MYHLEERETSMFLSSSVNSIMRIISTQTNVTMQLMDLFVALEIESAIYKSKFMIRACFVQYLGGFINCFPNHHM